MNYQDEEWYKLLEENEPPSHTDSIIITICILFIAVVIILL